MSQNENTPNYLTPLEVANILKLHKQTIIKWAASGKIPSYKIGYKDLRFKLDEVLKWIEQRAQNGKR